MIFPLLIFNILDAWDKDDTWTIFGKEINNRRIIPLILGGACVMVEVMLNFMGLLIWEWGWWSASFPFLQLLVYTVPMYLTTWIYDKDDLDLLKKSTPLIVITTISLFIIFTNIGWI